MNKTHYDEFFKHMVSEVKETRDAGQKEYASSNDVFDDFVKTAELTGATPGMVLYTFLNKHMRGIGSFIRGYKSQRENVKGRIKDAIVYLFLLWAMVEEEEHKEKLNKQQADQMANQKADEWVATTTGDK
tara:strand:- start:1242 stop:1631 length:390 start_codon:yes stop_codon:yes gene_type:complete